jgi:hypothetical protein
VIADRLRAVIGWGSDLDGVPRDAASRGPGAKHHDSRRLHRKPGEQVARL